MLLDRTMAEDPSAIVHFSLTTELRLLKTLTEFQFCVPSGAIKFILCIH